MEENGLKQGTGIEVDQEDLELEEIGTNNMEMKVIEQIKDVQDLKSAKLGKQRSWFQNVKKKKKKKVNKLPNSNLSKKKQSPERSFEMSEKNCSSLTIYFFGYCSIDFVTLLLCNMDNYFYFII